MSTVAHGLLRGLIGACALFISSSAFSADAAPVASPFLKGDAKAGEFDAIVIPGGYAPDKLRRYPKILDLVKDIHDAGKPVAFICHAGWVPISAGIVDRRRVTSVKAIRDDLITAGAEWVDEEVVVDGNLISSRTPDDLPAFGLALVEAMSRSKVAAAV